jgi:hypothetical protein
LDIHPVGSLSIAITGEPASLYVGVKPFANPPGMTSHEITWDGGGDFTASPAALHHPAALCLAVQLLVSALGVNGIQLARLYLKT